MEKETENVKTNERYRKQLLAAIGEELARYALVFREASGNAASISVQTIRTYARYLAGCEPERLRRAMVMAGQRADYWPRPHKILEAYRELTENETAGRRRVICNHCEGCGMEARGGTCLSCRGTGEKKENA